MWVIRIRASGLCKVYKLYWGSRALFREIFLRRPAHNPIVALNDVSFEVRAGESFGVVGDNGAGKSTLLKILSGTTFPTAGQVEVQGSVSALLELGTGFHPDFSGRDNIYFSGALMGLNREQVSEREDAIIAFSELSEFIDKPVKTYSTGMYVRLGFAVATGFDPDILIIDEALAVGDQTFQKKCTDRIVKFKGEGGTIFFCSHSLHQVKTLCQRAIWLDRGSVMALGESEEVVERYNEFCRGGNGAAKEKNHEAERESSRPPEVCWIESVRLTGSDGAPRNRFRTGETLILEIDAHFSEDFQGEPSVGVALVRNDGVVVYTVSNGIDGLPLKRTGPDKCRARLVFPNLGLLSGGYHFNVVTSDHHNLQAYDIHEKVQPFTVLHSEVDSGLIRLQHRWDE